MATLADYIEKNICVIRTLVGAGQVSPNCISNYKLFTFYKSLSNMPSKMDRYQFTADSNNVSLNTVRNAVRSMEAKVKL